MHVIVLGCGPSGAGLAESCAALGLQTLLVDADPDAPWPARYGVWIDEWPAELAHFTHRFDRATVMTHREHVVPRAYGILAGERVRALLRERYLARGGRVLKGRAAEVTNDGEHAHVRLDDGQRISARVVVDARGAGAPQDAGPLWQTAYGVEIVADLPLDPARMHLMDFRPPGEDRPVPSFLYAYQRETSRWFVEETVLAGPPVAMGELRGRLIERLSAWGVTEAQVADGTDEEHCRIPLMPSRYPGSGRVIPFGAAAGYVHPATGYSVSRSMARRERVAAAIGDLVGGASGVRLPAAVETAAERSARALFAFGAQEVSALEGPELRAFFDSFFRLPPALRDDYLGPGASPLTVGRAMWSVFWRTSPELRRILTRAGLRNAGHLGRALMGRTPPTLVSPTL